MKAINKIILSLVVVLLVMTVALTAMAVGDGVYTGTVEELTAKVDAVTAAENHMERADALDKVISYLDATPVDPAAQGYAEQMAIVGEQAILCANGYVGEASTSTSVTSKVTALDKAVKYANAFDTVDDNAYARFLANVQPMELEVAEELLADVNIASGTARNGININKVKAFLKNHALNEELEGYAEFAADWATKQKEQDDAIAAQIAGYNAGTPLAVYDVATYKQIDFSQPDSKELYGFTQNISESVSNFFEVRQAADGNHYYYFEYSAAAHSYTRVDLPKYEDGTVIELDITYFGKLPESGIEIGHSSVIDDAGVKHFPGYGSISSDGTFHSKTDKIKYTDFLVPGEWTKLTMVYTTSTGQIDYYINYELIGHDQGNAGLIEHKLNCFRIGSVNTDDKDPDYDGDFAIDNFTVYSGTSIRILDYISAMTDEERFAFYCSYLGSTDADIKDQKTAYEKAGLDISKYWDLRTQDYLTEDETLRQAVDYYLAFDYAPIYLTYQKENLANLVAMIDDLRGTARTLDSIDARAAKIASIDQYLTNTGADIYKGEDSEYATYSLYLSTERNEVDEDRAIIQFNGKVDRFYLAFNSKSMQQHYDNCMALLDSVNAALRDEPGFEAFKERYERFFDLDGDEEANSAYDLLMDSIRRENSKKIVECVDFIDEYTTVEQWEANYDFMDKYVLIIRAAAHADYDPDYEGVTEALAFFETIDGYFYEKLQQAHISHMQEQLDKYKVSESYIERIGLCAYLDNYLADANNDIDREDARVLEIKRMLEIYKSELEEREEDYKYYLEQNTVFFVNTVTRMLLASTYKEMYEAYTEAGIYYYAMNAGDESVADEIFAFEQMGEQIKIIEQNSSAFCEAMALYTAATTDEDKFMYLVLATDAKAFAEPTVLGVAEALDEYQAAYDAYMEDVNTTNGDLDAAGEIMASSRANCGVLPIVSAILALLGIK